jgi:hypothetical protein
LVEIEVGKKEQKKDHGFFAVHQPKPKKLKASNQAASKVGALPMLPSLHNPKLLQ